MKISFKDIKLTKKQIILIISGIVLLAVLTAGSIYLYRYLKDKEKDNTENNNEELLETADDSQEALSTIAQVYDTSDSEPAFKIYSQRTGAVEGYDESGVKMYDTCEIEKADTDSIVEIGNDPIEKPNHCTLHFSYSSLMAYILLPDGSLIAADSHAVLQINMYENETRIVQLNGEAYYRIAKQPEDKIFTVQMGNEVFVATGTEIFAHAYTTYLTDDVWMDMKDPEVLEDMTQEEIDHMLEPNWRAGFGVLDGSGNIISRGEDTNSEEAVAVTKGDYWGFEFQNYGNMEVVNSSKGTTSDLRDSIKALMTDRDPSDFNPYSNAIASIINLVNEQIAISENSFGGVGNLSLMNYDDIVGGLTAYIYEDKQASIVSLQEGIEEERQFQEEWNSFWDDVNNAYAEAHTVTVYGEPYCPYEGYELSADKTSCVYVGDGTSSTPEYYPSDGSSGTQATCGEPGSAVYQLCKMSIGLSGANSYMSGSKCCMNPDIEEPTLESAY